MKNNIFNLRALLISCFLVLGMSAFAQVTASGTVTDAANGEPIIGASILEVGTTNGTITDFDGNFTLNVNIWKEVHFNNIFTSSLTGFTTTAFYIERKTALLVTPGF